MAHAHHISPMRPHSFCHTVSKAYLALLVVALVLAIITNPWLVVAAVVIGAAITAVFTVAKMIARRLLRNEKVGPRLYAYSLRPVWAFISAVTDGLVLAFGASLAYSFAQELITGERSGPLNSNAYWYTAVACLYAWLLTHMAAVRQHSHY